MSDMSEVVLVVSNACVSGGNAWTAASSDMEQYLVVDLRSPRNVTAVATQGRPRSSEYVAEYIVSYGTNGLDYADFKEPGGNVKVGKQD
jgi:contactin associated protein-like 2